MRKKVKRDADAWRKMIALEFPLNKVHQDIVAALADYTAKEDAASTAERNLRDVIDRTCQSAGLWDARRHLLDSED